MTTIFSQAGLSVTCEKTREPRISIIRFDISKFPDQFETVMGVVGAFVNTLQGRFVVHVIVTADETLGVSQATSLVGQVVKMQAIIDEGIKGTIIQAGPWAQRINMSLTLLKTLYKSTRVSKQSSKQPSKQSSKRSSKHSSKYAVEVVDTTEYATQILDGILTHEAKKRVKREANRMTE